MNTHAMNSNSQATGTGERALRWIGDLDHPFYSDERNRYVWYEASAIAFQLLFLSSYVMTGLVLLVFGAPAMLYALILFAPTIVTAIVFQHYLSSRSAEYWPGWKDLLRGRGQVAVGAAVLLLMGLIRAVVDLQSGTSGPTASFLSGSKEGLIAGLLTGPIAAIGVLAFKRRAALKAEELDED